ncbi:hypothetical protein LEMLEM_LOCUS19061 [Lemmus lemmus]
MYRLATLSLWESAGPRARLCVSTCSRSLRLLAPRNSFRSSESVLASSLEQIKLFSGSQK